MRTIDTLTSGTSAHSAQRGASAGGFGATVIAAFNAGVDAISAMLERRRSRLFLLGLTDDQLKDIGLSRADAEREGLRKPWE